MELGAGCRVDSHVRLDGPLVAGQRNVFFHGACIGAVPQDLKFAGARTGVRIGDGNIFREFVTVNRATAEGTSTVIGDQSLLMAYVHVAHDCIIHDHVILATLTVTIHGHTDVAATADTNDVTEDATPNTATGNVLTNDVGVGLTVSAVIGSAANVGVDVPGAFGIFHIGS